MTDEYGPCPKCGKKTMTFGDYGYGAPLLGCSSCGCVPDLDYQLAERDAKE